MTEPCMTEPASGPCCPTCKRPFKAITDYPAITINTLTINPKPLPQHQSMFSPPEHTKQEIQEDLDGCVELQDYLHRLKELAEFSKERTIIPRELLPIIFQKDSYFSWAYKLPTRYSGFDIRQSRSSQRLWLALQDPAPGICEVELYTTGPNFGSGGGPSLLSLGVIATITYTGVIA